MSFKQPPLETQDNRQFEDYRVKKHYSSSADVLEATGFSVDFLKSIGNLTDNQVESLISNYISRADERIRRMLGIPVTVRKEGHEFFNNPVVQLGPEREDPFEFFGAYNPTNRVVEVYAIYYNNYRTKIPYPKDWDQFTEDTTGWGTENGTIAKDTSDFKCGTASLKATITGSQGGSIYYPSTKNLHKRIYPWFYAGFWFKTDNKDALFDFRIVRDTGSYYHNTFKVSNEDTWETVQLSIRRFQFVNVGGEGEQAPFNWILIYTEWFQIVADRPCNFWIDNFSFNDGFFATYPSGEIAWCVDEQTEVLTREGWKFFKDLTYDDEIATLNKDNSIEYQKPSNIIILDYAGKMLLFQSRYADMMITPNHNLYIAPYGRNYNKYRLQEAETIQLTRFKLKADAKWKGKQEKWFYLGKNKIEMKQWLRFLAWYLSEGCSQKENRISIFQTDGQKIKEIESVISNIGFTPCVYTRENGEHTFAIYSKELNNYLAQFGNCYEKYVPNFVKELTPELINEFLKTYAKGDGTFNKNGTIKTIYTTSLRMANDLQELFLKAGYVASISILQNRTRYLKNGKKIIPKALCYKVNVRNRMLNATLENKPKIIDYIGKVYCVTVPNYHIIYVRRNGKPNWTGNCMPEWYPTGRITVTYSYDPFLDSIPPALEEASSKLAGVLLFDWVIGKRQMAIAFSQLSDSLAEVPDRETLENTRRRLETEAMAALESLGFRTWEGLA